MKTHRSIGPLLPSLALLASGFFVSPASAQTTQGSFDRPPFYHGKLSASASPIAHVAVSFRDDPTSLDPTPSDSSALAALLDSLRVELDRMNLTVRLAGGDWPMKDGPQVRFGCRRGGIDTEGLPRASDEIDPAEPRRMNFEYTDPGRAWRERVQKGAADSVGAVLAIQVGFSEQWVRQTSWKGSKSIELGTNRSMSVAWLTSLDDPVQVLQITGVVMTPKGKVLRLGAEGLLARRTGMTTSMAGAQEVLRQEELAELMATRDGIPAAWKSALRGLVTGLTTPSRR